MASNTSITISQKLAQKIDGRIEDSQGEYTSRAEFVRAAIRKMLEEKRTNPN